MVCSLQLLNLKVSKIVFVEKKYSFKDGYMKRYIVLFAVFLAALFFYPVFAHADKIGHFFSRNPVSEPVALFVLGSGLLIAAGLTKRLIRN